MLLLDVHVQSYTRSASTTTSQDVKITVGWSIENKLMGVTKSKKSFQLESGFGFEQSSSWERSKSTARAKGMDIRE